MSDDPEDDADATSLVESAETDQTADADGDPEPAGANEDATDDRTDGSRFRRFLNYGLLAGLLLFALVAAVGFYTAVSSAISTWVADEWRPLFRAAFNLAILLLTGAGIVWQARRLS
ncbi:MAG: hypothetical protein ABEI80_01015 [Haloplanus sp.]